MKRLNQMRFLTFCCIAFAIILSGSTMGDDIGAKKRYRIEEGSKFYLKGTSNVNKFTCDCEDRFEMQELEIESSGGYSRFRHANLALRVKNFNCHNRKIDADMQKALQADAYPTIKVSLVDTWQQAKCMDGSCYNWFDVQANVQITIAKVTSKEFIKAKARMLGPNKFQLKGEKALQMSAFGIAPPEAMFGMIKVNDGIDFHFDVVVTVDELL
ncbi:MAG: hypothetical protein JNJ57_17150 [Saprospiraceae bacterium]|nr:hypothetical protein [Saprospiraceae bacterium]